MTEKTYFGGYATGSGEYIGSDSEDVSLDMTQKIPYDEATGF